MALGAGGHLRHGRGRCGISVAAPEGRVGEDLDGIAGARCRRTGWRRQTSERSSQRAAARSEPTGPCARQGWTRAVCPSEGPVRERRQPEREHRPDRGRSQEGSRRTRIDAGLRRRAPSAFAATTCGASGIPEGSRWWHHWWRGWWRARSQPDRGRSAEATGSIAASPTPASAGCASSGQSGATRARRSTHQPVPDGNGPTW